MNLLGIYDREEGFKILAFDIAQWYDDAQRFVITDAELSKFGREVGRVTREEVSMDTIKRAIDLGHFYSTGPIHYCRASPTKNVIFPSWKKYESCRV